MKKYLALFCLWVASNAVYAVPVALDFSTFSSEGQSYEGATVGDVNFTSETGDLSYTNSYGGGLRTGGGSTGDIFMDFAVAIDSFSVRAGDGAGDLDAFGISVFEFATNNFLGSFVSPQFGGSNEPEWYTLNINLANIGRIVFDPCNSGVCPGSSAGLGGLVITDIAYNTMTSVPEPMSLILLGVGLLGAGYRYRKSA